ncbi:glutamate-rich protein 2 isoform X1 [Engraulis encrasicolus]|uniref:glutamate-rich protein 2 isoform X1 n=1 Tax=Engraulis encrasicolus TaxID=184585 RepID=UPI002FCFCA51
MMSRHTLQCIGTSTTGRSDSKGTCATQHETGEPARRPSEFLHRNSGSVVRPVPKAGTKDQRMTKTTATSSPKAKQNGSCTMRHRSGKQTVVDKVKVKNRNTVSFLHSLGERARSTHGAESRHAAVKQPVPAAPLQPPLSSLVGTMRPPLSSPPPALAEEGEEQVGTAAVVGPPLVPLVVPSPPSLEVRAHSRGAPDAKGGLQGGQSPSEEEDDDEEEEGDDEDEESSDENQEPQRTAPLELMAEFLKAVMEKDYLLSQKLCQMILIYEPENPEARLFLPLIEERLLMAQEAEEERKKEEEEKGSSSGEDEEDEEEDDTSDDDDGGGDDTDDDSSEGDTDGSGSSSSSSSEEEDEEDSNTDVRRSGEEQERCKRAAVLP